jgi:hypothetical protein
VTFEPEPHRFVKLGRLPYVGCIKCGLVRLNNRFTEWAMKNGCNNDEHPQYEQMKRSTRPEGL